MKNFKTLFFSPNKDYFIAQFNMDYKSESLNNNTNFNQISKISKKIKLLDNKLFNKCEKVRIMRNKIHLMSLTDVEDKYTKKDIEDVFEVAKEVVERVRSFNK